VGIQIEQSVRPKVAQLAPFGLELRQDRLPVAEHEQIGPVGLIMAFGKWTTSKPSFSAASLTAAKNSFSVWRAT
jgi:hypothetical protein